MRTALFAAITLGIIAGAAEAQPTDPVPATAIDDDFGAPAPVATPETAEAVEVAQVDRAYIAVGGARALSDVAGPAALFRMTDSLDLDAIVGVAKFSGATGPTSALGLAVGVRQTLARRGAVALSVGGRVGLAHLGSAQMGGSRTRYLVEIPARIELAATPWLRLHVEGGLAVGFEPGTEATGETGSGSDGETLWTLGAAGLAAGAGFAIAIK